MQLLYEGNNYEKFLMLQIRWTSYKSVLNEKMNSTDNYTSVPDNCILDAENLLLKNRYLMQLLIASFPITFHQCYLKNSLITMAICCFYTTILSAKALTITVLLHQIMWSSMDSNHINIINP